MWDFILVLRRQALENQPRNILRLDACLATASTIIDQVEAAANEGWLVVLQDTAACMTSALTVLLHKVRAATRLGLGRGRGLGLGLDVDSTSDLASDLTLPPNSHRQAGWKGKGWKTHSLPLHPAHPALCHSTSRALSLHDLV
jgi:hypothetical protein